MKTKQIALASALIFASASFLSAQDTRYVYFNPKDLSGDIEWGSVPWVDEDGNSVAAPDANSSVWLQGPRAGSYRHVTVAAGSNIVINDLVLANSGWGGNGYKTLEIKGTAESGVVFTATHGVNFAENFNSLYASYTKFTAGISSIPYYGRMSFDNSTVELGTLSGGNMTTMSFDKTTANVNGMNLLNGGVTTVENSSSLTLTADFYTSGNHNLTVKDSSFTAEGNFVITSTAGLAFTNATIDINTGMRISSGNLNFSAENSSVLVRRSTYSGGTTTGIAVADGAVATISLINSTINTGNYSIDIRNAASTISISMMDESVAAITCGNLNFTGVLTVDFTGMDLLADTSCELISANNARTVFEALLAAGNVNVLGLKAGESYEWDITDTSIVLNFFAIPEASAYAAVFGALALAFAAWRKRR